MKRKYDKTTEAVISFLMKQVDLAYDYTEGFPPEMQQLGISEEAFYRSCRYLKVMGLCDDAYDQNGKVCGISIGHKLLHREEFFWIDVREFLFQSIAVPIVVSLLTTAVIGIGALCWAHINNGSRTTTQNVPETITETQNETSTEITSHLGS